MNVTAAWAKDCDHLTLNDIILNVKVGQLCAIIGPVGAGKVCLYNFSYIYMTCISTTNMF